MRPYGGISVLFTAAVTIRGMVVVMISTSVRTGVESKAPCSLNARDQRA